MSLSDWMKLGGVLVLIAGMLILGARFLWWALDMDSILHMFSDDGPRK